MRAPSHLSDAARITPSRITLMNQPHLSPHLLPHLSPFTSTQVKIGLYLIEHYTKWHYSSNEGITCESPMKWLLAQPHGECAWAMGS